jgi:hypothetical protein
MMLQAVATCLFAAVALIGFGTIAALLRADWDAFTVALGLCRPDVAPAPLPPRYRVIHRRRTAVIKLEVVQRRAAA